MQNVRKFPTWTFNFDMTDVVRVQNRLGRVKGRVILGYDA